LAFNYVQNLDESAIYVDRDFYGIVKIYENEYARTLYHGMTLHGSQRIDGENEFQPTIYYVPTSGGGRAVGAVRAQNDNGPLRVGVVGLGAGTLASYCRNGDQFTFYEIDPRIETIAREYFTYLDNCEQAGVRIGDGRLLLEKDFEEGNLKYDVLLIDAFSDDTVPVHLLTKEAVSLYTSLLRDEKSILAIHTSNRYILLTPVVLRIAEELGLASLEAF